MSVSGGAGSLGCAPSGAGFIVWFVAFAVGVWIADVLKVTIFAEGDWQELSVVDSTQCIPSLEMVADPESKPKSQPQISTAI